jgi:hypothetical protein
LLYGTLSKFRFIAPYFESVTGSPLTEGMVVLVEVQVNYSQLYGLSLIINGSIPSVSKKPSRLSSAILA